MKSNKNKSYYLYRLKREELKIRAFIILTRVLLLLVDILSRCCLAHPALDPRYRSGYRDIFSS